MRLPDFLQAADLNALRQAMGATLSASFRMTQVYKPIALPEIGERLRNDGIDVGFDELKVLKDGTLSYQGHRVILYIRDVGNYAERKSLPKYHLAYCRTLDEMRKYGKSSKFVVANRDDGKFVVNITGDKLRSQIAKLDICQNCLAKISWKGFRIDLGKAERRQFVQAFRLQEFFQAYPRDLIAVKPDKTSDTAPLNDYPANWQAISEAFKAANGYRCMKCHLVLSGLHSRYLHVHHKNGQKNECQPGNLEALCIRCHADEPLHSHMKDSPDYRIFASMYAASRGR